MPEVTIHKKQNRFFMAWAQGASMVSVAWGSRKKEEKGAAATSLTPEQLFQPDLWDDGIRNLHPTRIVHILSEFGLLLIRGGRCEQWVLGWWKNSTLRDLYLITCTQSLNKLVLGFSSIWWNEHLPPPHEEEGSGHAIHLLSQSTRNPLVLCGYSNVCSDQDIFLEEQRGRRHHCRLPQPVNYILESLMPVTKTHILSFHCHCLLLVHPALLLQVRN